MSLAQEVKKEFKNYLKRSLTRDLVLQNYGNKDPRVLSGHLKIYREHLQPESQALVDETKRLEKQLVKDRIGLLGSYIAMTPNPPLEGGMRTQDITEGIKLIKQSRLDLKQTQEQLNQIRKNSNLFYNIHEPEGSSVGSRILNALSLNGGLSLSRGFPPLGGVVSLGVGFDTKLNELFLKSSDKDWNHPLHRRKQEEYFIYGLKTHVLAREEFRKQFPSLSDEEIQSGNWCMVPFLCRSDWKFENGIVYFKDSQGNERHFNQNLLNAFEKSADRKSVVHYMLDLESQSLEDLFDHFPEESILYSQVLMNEGLQKFMEQMSTNQEDLLQNQDQLRESLVDLSKDLTDFQKNIQAQVGENKNLILKFMNRSFTPRSFKEIKEAIKGEENSIKEIEEELEGSHLSLENRKALEARQELHRKNVQQLRAREIQKFSRILQGYIHTGSEATIFFARLLNASPETLQGIYEVHNFLQGSLLAMTSLALVSNSDFFAIGGVFQGLNQMLFGQRQGPDIGKMLQEHTKQIISSIQEGVSLIIQHQEQIHRDLRRQIIDSEARLVAEVQLVGHKVDHVQRTLYDLSYFLEQSVEQIREELSQARLSLLSRQVDIRKAQDKILTRIASLEDKILKEFQRETTQSLLNRASGFSELFQEEARWTSMTLCREDFSKCTEGERNQMREIRKLMGELSAHVNTTLRSNQFSYDFSNLKKENISSYLDNQKNSVEDRLNLFPSIGEWLNAHIDSKRVKAGVHRISGSFFRSFQSLPHPDLFLMILDQYIELGSYLPVNEVGIPRNPDGRSEVNEGIDLMCKEFLRYKEVSQDIREGIPLAWEVYKSYLRNFEEIYFSLKESYENLFYQNITGISVENSNTDLKEAFNPIVSSPLFVDDDFSTDTNMETVSLEGGNTIPGDIEVSLRDLLFLPEEKIKIFVENMELEDLEILAEKVDAYIVEQSLEGEEDQNTGGCKIEEGCLEVSTQTCQAREWETLKDVDHLFPNGKNLSNDFWGPKSFEVVAISSTRGDASKKSLYKMDFDCESKGEGHHVVRLFRGTRTTRKYFLFFKVEEKKTTYGTWLHYVCKKVDGDLYDESGNRYTGKAWQVEVYEKSDTSSKEAVLSSEKRGSHACVSCPDKNKNRCSTSDVFEDEFNISSLFRSERYDLSSSRFSYSGGVRYHCGWHKPKEKQSCKSYVKGSLVVEKPKTQLSQIRLISNLKRLRSRVLIQFKKHIYSLFSGESVDPSMIEVSEFHQSLVRNLSLAKLALVSLMYGGFGKTFLEQRVEGSGLYSFIQALPSGYGSGRTLLNLRRFPGDQPFSLISNTSATVYDFREWMFRTENLFSFVKELNFNTNFNEEKEVLLEVSSSGGEANLTSSLGFGNPIYTQSLLSLASINRNLMMSEECLKGLGLVFEPLVIQTQFPHLESESEEKRLAIARFAGEGLSSELKGEKGEAVLRILANDEEPAIRMEVAIAAGKLETEGSFEILAYLARDLNAEVKLKVAQVALDLERVNRARIFEILSQDSNEQKSKLNYLWIKDRILALLGFEGREAELNFYLILSKLGAVATQNREASLLLSAFFNYHYEEFKEIEVQLIQSGLFRKESQKEERDFYNLLRSILSFGSQGNPEANVLFNLFIHYRTKDEGIRESIANHTGSLARKGLEKSQAALILEQFVYDESDHVKIATARAAGYIIGDEGIEVLKKMTSSRWPVKFAVLLSMANIESNQAVDTLEQQIFDFQSSDTGEYIAVDTRERNMEDRLLLMQLIDEEDPDARLRLAARDARYPSIVQAVLESGANINGMNANRETLLHLAARYNENPSVAALLIEKGADVNAKDNSGRTPLNLAVRYNTADVVTLLINRGGAYVNAQDDDGLTPLHVAAESNTADVATLATLLINRGGAYVNAQDDDGLTPLHVAAESNTAIDRGANVNAKNNDGWTPLSMANIESNQAVDTLEQQIFDFQSSTGEYIAVDTRERNVALLIDRGANVNALKNMEDRLLLMQLIDEEDPDALRLAARDARYPSIVQAVLESGANINGVNANRETLLHLAARYNENPSVAALLIEKGANVGARDKYGNTPLHVAAEYNKTDVAILLIGKGANVNAKNNDGLTPLHVAAKESTADVAILLIKKGADFNADDNKGRIPLHFAAQSNTADVATLLIDRGANVNAKNNDGWTPLHFAAQSNTADVVALLIKKGADISAKSYGGDRRERDDGERAPLHVAAQYNTADVATLLIDRGANVNAKNNDGWTPLHVAAEYNKTDVAILLIGKGANVNAKSNNGNTPLHVTAQYNKTDVATLLINRGASVNAKDKYGYTPLHHAAQYNKTDVAILLINRGANVNARDNDGNTPLGWAVHRNGNNSSVAKLLLDRGGRRRH